MVEKKADFRRKRRRLDNPPYSDSDSDSNEDAGSSDGAYDELYDTDNGEGDDDDEGGDNDDITEPLEEEEEIALHRKRKLQEIYGAERSQSKGMKSKENLRVPTSAEEVKRLRETEKLFHSNLYRLQIEEMLKEVKIKKKYKEKFDEWFPLLLTSLLEMDDQEERNLADVDWLEQQGIALPLDQSHAFKGRFTFQPPTSVDIVGSYGDGCALGPKINVDVAVQMPEVMIHKKDFQNERFHRKRSLFLCCIAAHLQSSDLIVKDGDNAPKFVCCYGGDPLMPVLEVAPSGYLAEKAKVRIHVFAPSTVFKISALSPSKNNKDTALFYPDAKTGNPATPLYNASILAALVTPENDALKSSSIASHQNILDALILLKTWLRQRGLDQGFAGFGTYLMTMLVVHLIGQRRIAPQMSSYQVVRIVWNYLSETDWTKPESVPSLAKDKQDTKINVTDFSQHYDVVFLDVTGRYNLAYSVNATTYNRVRSESRLALQMLDNTTIDSFQALFITPMPFSRQFDHVMRFKNHTGLETMIAKKATLRQKLDNAGNTERLAVEIILAEFQRALSKRVKQWGIFSDFVGSWPTSKVPPKHTKAFSLGLNLDPQHAFSIIDKGPPANEPEANNFREFWGEKSELRRFQDGSISEAVVWLEGKSSLAQRRTACKLIIEYILQYRLGLAPEKNLIYIADQVERTLHRPNLKHPDFNYGTGEEAALAVQSAFGKLSKNVRALEDLPLEITEIQGVSPTFRYAEVFPPVAAALVKPKKAMEKENCVLMKIHPTIRSTPPYVPILEVVVSLGLSSKWPSQAEAVRRLRAAFNIKIGKGLNSSFKLTTCAHPDYIDVIQDGYVFRLRLAYQNEIALLKETTLPDGSIKYRDTPDSLSLEQKIIHLPSISGCLHGLHQQAPAFGPTACLAKRWISSQLMIGEHMPEIVIELLVASVFLHAEPFSTPAQPQTAFLRFLHFLGKTNWHTQPVILNFRDDMTKEEMTEIEKYFGSNRKELPPLFIATPTDHKKSVWTLKAPSLTMLIRLAQLAQAALSVLEQPYHSKNPKLNSWHQIFQADLSVYDALIHLKPFAVSRRWQALNFSDDATKEVNLKPYKQESGEKIPVIDFDNVQLYIRELRESFGDFALFFYDMYGGTAIGVVWKPAAFDPKKFSVNQINGKHLVDGSLVLNRDAILEDFTIIGKDLVSHVDTPGGPGRTVLEEE